MQKRLKTLLRSANLKEEEILLYLLLLKLKNATVQTLTTQSSLNPMMVYRTLNRLLEQGLIKQISINYKQHSYSPLSINSLIKKIEKQHQKLKKIADCLKYLSPLTSFLDPLEEDDGIEIREGVQALKEEYLKMPQVCKYEYTHIGSIQNLWKITGLSYEAPEERNFIHQRLSKGIYARIINTRHPAVEEFAKLDSLEKRTTQMKEKLPVMKNYFGIAEDHHSVLFICDQDNPRAIITRQPELLSIQKQYFKQLWGGF